MTGSIETAFKYHERRLQLDVAFTPNSNHVRGLVNQSTNQSIN